MRAIGAGFVAMTMTISGAFAADGMLAPGKPAGTKEAQIESGGVLLVAGILVAAGGIALIASRPRVTARPPRPPVLRVRAVWPRARLPARPLRAPALPPAISPAHCRIPQS